MTYLFTAIFLFLALLVYFRLAFHFRIIDIPNSRSSHHSFTIRGGGIIFLVAIIIGASIHSHSVLYLPILATLLLGTVSFIDDAITLSWGLRFAVQFFATFLLFYTFSLFGTFPLWALIPLFILVLGTINAYNFMDGINGMTGLYSLILLASLQFINYKISRFIEPDLIWMPMIACGVFLYFNFRKKAKCFAGDVGSITMAFWAIYLIFNLVAVTHHWVYVLLLSVYGVETSLTIIHRIIRRENILEAHRLHFFQLLVNELGWPHLLVSGLYAGIQAVVNVIIIAVVPTQAPILICALVLLPLSVLYVSIKPYLMRLLAAGEADEVRLNWTKKKSHLEIVRGGRGEEAVSVVSDMENEEEPEEKDKKHVLF